MVAQPLLAFAGALDDAIRGKNTIFDRKASYNRAFEEKSARHILFVYALSRAIDDIRSELKDQNAQGELLKAQEKRLRIARSVRFKYFFMAVIGGALESVLNRKIDRGTVAFSQEASMAKNKTMEELAVAWKPVAQSVFFSLSFTISGRSSGGARRSGAGGCASRDHRRDGGRSKCCRAAGIQSFFGITSWIRLLRRRMPIRGWQ